MSETLNPCQSVDCEVESDVEVYSLQSEVSGGVSTISSGSGETQNPCQNIDCAIDSDVDIYSLQSLPPIAPLAPSTTPGAFGNSELTYCCSAGATIDYIGEGPGWLLVDRALNCVSVLPSAFRGATQAAADVVAQSFLDDFVTDSLADDTLACSSGFPTLLATITGLTGEEPFQSAWDPDNAMVWTSWGYDGVSPKRISRVDVSANTATEFTPTAGKPIGLQYVPDIAGAYSGELLYYNRPDQIGTFLPVSPYTQTDVQAITSGGGQRRALLWIPEKQMLFGSLGVQPTLVKIARIDFISGVLTEQQLVAAAHEVNNYTFNPLRNEILITTQGGYGVPPPASGMTAVNTSTFAESLIDLGVGYTTVSNRCSAYCPDNELIYIPYKVSISVYGVALVNANTNVLYATQDIGGAATFATAIVYHPARRYMYIFETNKLHVIDTTKYDQGSAMVLGTVVFSGTVTMNPAVYCPTTRRVYLPTPQSEILVFT